MLVVLALSLASPATACSCGRPPFDVVGAPRAAPHEEIVHPREGPYAEPDLVVPPSPVLTITRISRSPGRPSETVAGTARFVRLDTGAAITAITVRRRFPKGVGEGYVQIDVRPAQALEVGVTYAIEMWSYPGTRRPGWYGVRLHINSATEPAGPIPHEIEWQFTLPRRVATCEAGGWTMLVGDPDDEAVWGSMYDLFVKAPDAAWRFWGTYAGPVVGNTGSKCANYAFGSDAPPDTMKVRVVPRELSGRFDQAVEITPPERPAVQGAADVQWWDFLYSQ